MAESFIHKLKPYYIRKGLRYLRHYGPHDFAVRVRERLAPDEVPYGPWFEKHRADEEELSWQRAEFPAGAGRRQPLFSVIVPVYRTPERFLREMAESVLAQSCPYWELVIVNASPEDGTVCRILQEYVRRDERIRTVTLEKNGGIAANTNAGISAASGSFVCFMDHDDLLMPDALYEVWRVLTESAREKSSRRDVLPEESPAQLLYTDEDKIRDNGKGGLEHFQPNFKPDYSPDLLRTNNYICHLLIVRRSLALSAGLLKDEFNGAQDHEFILRCIDSIRRGRECVYPVREKEIIHIPKVLYSWRVHEASTADNPDSKQYAYDAGLRAIAQHLERQGVRGLVSQTKDHGFYRVRYEEELHPMVSILIPNCEMRRMLERCLTSIREHTRYDHYEVIVIENNSSSKEILEYYRKIQGKDHVRVIRFRGEFNFSRICNFGVQQARGSFLVFMNNDVQVKDGWLTELLSVCERREVGAAGPKLYYPDGRIQSAGIAVGIGGVAGSLFTGMNGSFGGYMHRASVMQDLSAVTGALMMVKRIAFERAGGFSEQLPVAFNDVDLCLKLRAKGYLVVYDPYAEAVHHESASRGDEYTAAKAERFREASDYMKKTWADYYEQGDPYYNANFSLAKWNCALRPD